MIELIETTAGPRKILSDDTVISTLIREKKTMEWDEPFITLPEVQRLNSGSVVVDAGAYIGDTAETFIRLGATVYAFEPRPDAFECLQFNCPGPKVYAFPLALGHGEYYRFGEENENKGARRLTTSDKGPYMAIKLDHISIPSLDFLKIDVEGWEYSVLRGARMTIGKFRPSIAIEINPSALAVQGRSELAIHNFLEEQNYQWREYYRFKDENWDLICTPK